MVHDVVIDGWEFVRKSELLGAQRAADENRRTAVQNNLAAEGWKRRALDAENKVLRLEDDLVEANEVINERRTCSELEVERDELAHIRDQMRSERDEALANAAELQESLDMAIVDAVDSSEQRDELIQSAARLMDAITAAKAENVMLRARILALKERLEDAGLATSMYQGALRELALHGVRGDHDR